jgi:16S rRNA (cytosine1402-N4)-methyltransferase
MSRPSGHIPVFHSTVLDLLKIQPGNHVLDVTLGLGGHASSFLEANAPDGTLIGLDADTKNLDLAKDRLQIFQERFIGIHANFRELPSCLPDPIDQFDIIFADLGLSSPHIDDASRGFTFRSSSSLDMRFDQTTGKKASDLLMEESEEELKSIFQNYGEVKNARRLASHIVRERKTASLETSDSFNGLIENIFGYKTPSVLPQIYQALRIAVNDEQGSLAQLLSVLPSLMKPGARAGIISYHSLEDRLVKQAFRMLTTPTKDETTGQVSVPASFSLLTRRPILCDPSEATHNPRARSAVLRGLLRLS